MHNLTTLEQQRAFAFFCGEQGRGGFLVAFTVRAFSSHHQPTTKKERETMNSDLELYEELLQSTANEEGVCNSARAIELLTAQLGGESKRTRAEEIGKRFDEDRDPPDTSDVRQLLFDEKSWIVLGGHDRIRFLEAKPEHVRRYLAVLEERQIENLRTYLDDVMRAKFPTNPTEKNQ
jgi:hypothetical protein